MEQTYLLIVSGNRYIVRDSFEQLSAMFIALRSHNVEYEYRGFHDYQGATQNVIQFLDTLLLGGNTPDSETK